MRRSVFWLALIAALAASEAAAQAPPFPQTLPSNTVVGRLGVSPGPAQAIPFAALAARMGITVALLATATSTAVGEITLTPTSPVSMLTGPTDRMLVSFTPPYTSGAGYFNSIASIVGVTGGPWLIYNQDGQSVAYSKDLATGSPVTLQYSTPLGGFIIVTSPPPTTGSTALYPLWGYTIQPAVGGGSVSLVPTVGAQSGGIPVWNSASLSYRQARIAGGDLTASLFDGTANVEGTANQSIVDDELYGVYLEPQAGAFGHLSVAWGHPIMSMWRTSQGFVPTYSQDHILALVRGSVTASAASSTLTVTAVGFGSVSVGSYVPALGRTVTAQASGTPGGIGTYTLDGPGTSGSTTMQIVDPARIFLGYIRSFGATFTGSITSNVLTINAGDISAGGIVKGQTISWSGGPAGVTITGTALDGGGLTGLGGPGTYSVSTTPNRASISMTAGKSISIPIDGGLCYMGVPSYSFAFNGRERFGFQSCTFDNTSASATLTAQLFPQMFAVVVGSSDAPRVDASTVVTCTGTVFPVTVSTRLAVETFAESGASQTLFTRTTTGVILASNHSVALDNSYLGAPAAGWVVAKLQIAQSAGASNTCTFSTSMLGDLPF